MTDITQRIEDLGPAERLIQSLLTHADHMVHNRPGIVTQDPTTFACVKWEASTYKMEGGEKIAYFLRKVGKKSERVRAGVLGDDGVVRENARVIGEYRLPGFFPEIVRQVYRQVADIYNLDNDFAARWASYAFGQEHRDLKVVLCAFMLVQTRRGDPVTENGKVLFADEDYRDVGEAMCLIRRPDGKDFNPKLLLRVGDLLAHPEVARINRELGFTGSAKNPAMGRWPRVVEKYLRHREANPNLLTGLVQKAGFRTTLLALAQRIGYKPTTPAFFRILRWKQKQSLDGRRTIAIGEAVTKAESWEGLGEAEICERIMLTRPSYKRIVGMLPANVGITRAIMVAAVVAGGLSNQDLIILSPTLEELGLTTVEPVKARWEAALAKAENQRAVHIAQRVKSSDVANKLQTAADTAMQRAVEKVVRGLRIYVMVDISSSMTTCIDLAKEYIAKLLGGFPLDHLHVSVFNTNGRVLRIQSASKAGVEAAFRGINASGGTDYGAGVSALADFKPTDDEDVLFLFVGDEQARDFDAVVRTSGLRPSAFGLVKIGYDSDRCVRNTATRLGIPCFTIDKDIFDDVYAIPRMLQNLIASTPVATAATVPGRATPVRVSLVATILKTDLLAKPAWAM